MMRKHWVGVAFAVRECLQHWSFSVVKEGPDGDRGKLFSGMRGTCGGNFFAYKLGR